MESNPSALEALSDLWFTTVKLLGRPAVQLQLVAGLGTLLLAWLLATALLRGWDRRRQARTAQRAERARHGLESTAGDGDNSQANAVAPVDGNGVELDTGEILGSPGRLYLLFSQLLFPLIALALAYGANLYFVNQGWTNGLLIDLIALLGIFLIYRLFIGMFYVFFDPPAVAKHQRRLFAPLFAVVVALLVLSKLTDLSDLAQATVFPSQAGVLTLGALLLATVGLYFWFMTVALLKDIALALLSRRRGANPGALNATLTLVQYGLLALGLFGVFRLLQLDPAMVAAVTGGLSIGVGFALQDVLKNFIGGLIVLFEGSVRPGDWVEIAATEGEIDKLSIRSTIVRTFDNVEYIVPNQDWLSSTVTTYTRNSRRARARVPIGVSYNANPRFVQQLLVDTARQHPDVLQDPPPRAALVDFGASSVDFVVLAWVADAKFRGKTASELRYMIWDAFAEHGIEIPYPQQDLHIRSGLPASPEPAPNGEQAGQHPAQNG